MASAFVRRTRGRVPPALGGARICAYLRQMHCGGNRRCFLHHRSAAERDEKNDSVSVCSGCGFTSAPYAWRGRELRLSTSEVMRTNDNVTALVPRACVE
jgi:hypothetical protein